MLEEWKDIPGYVGLYQASNLGQIFSIRTNKILINQRSKTGYMAVMLYSKGVKRCYVHRTVVESFIRILLPGEEVNHLDGNKENNNLSNFEICNRSENAIHAYKTGLRKSPKFWKGKFGGEHHRSKPVEQYTLDGKLISIFNGFKEASRKTGIDQGDISRVCSGKRKTAHGFIWKYFKN